MEPRIKRGERGGPNVGRMICIPEKNIYNMAHFLNKLKA
jgi:hypothetical protein